jgi:hypothetical protein
MIIESFSFASITVDGRTYTRDMILLPDRILYPLQPLCPKGEAGGGALHLTC